MSRADWYLFYALVNTFFWGIIVGMVIQGAVVPYFRERKEKGPIC